MKNQYNLPRTLLQAMSNQMSKYKKDGDISVTQLIDSPQVFRLKKNNPDIEDDYAHRIKAFIGTLVHNALKEAEHSTIKSDGRLQATFNVYGKDIIIDGEADYYDPEYKVLRDYKTASVNSKDFKDAQYEKQLNLYAYLFETNGYPVEKLEIVYIYTDWSIKRAKEDAGYPLPTRIVEVPLWGLESQKTYIQERLDKFYSANVECTEDDQWAKPTTYAVFKAGGKRALSVHQTRAQAMEAINSSKNKNELSIEVREGEYTRCKYYCAYNKVCPQFK